MVTLMTPAFEHVVACRHCGCRDDVVRYGYTKGGNQRYRCLACKHTFCLNPGTTAHPEAFKEQVLRSYQERCSMRGVARIFGISRTTLAEWLEKNYVGKTDLSSCSSMLARKASGSRRKRRC